MALALPIELMGFGFKGLIEAASKSQDKEIGEKTTAVAKKKMPKPSSKEIFAQPSRLEKIVSFLSMIIPPYDTFTDPTLTAEVMTYSSNDCMRSLGPHI